MSEIEAHAQVHEGAHAELSEHSEPSFDEVDRGFGGAVAVGYAGGLIVIFVLMVLVFHNADPSLPWYTQALMAAGVAFWIGIMGGVVAVGKWAQKHEKELFGH